MNKLNMMNKIKKFLSSFNKRRFIGCSIFSTLMSLMLLPKLTIGQAMWYDVVVILIIVLPLSFDDLMN
jgi:hypothetical protein